MFCAEVFTIKNCIILRSLWSFLRLCVYLIMLASKGEAVMSNDIALTNPFSFFETGQYTYPLSYRVLIAQDSEPNSTSGYNFPPGFHGLCRNSLAT